MNPLIHSCGIVTDKPTLSSLKEKLTDIDARICSCSHWGLSYQTTETVITELKALKVEIKMQMYELIDQL